MSDPLVEITSTVINQQIENVTNRLSGEIKSLWTKHISSFRSYITNANKRYESTKTLLYKDKSVFLRDIYVGTRLSQGLDDVEENEFVEQLLQGNRCLVCATAGAGKSFFSKWLFLTVLGKRGSIPIFVELRNLNGTDLGFIDYIVQDLRNNFKVSISKSNMVDLIGSGRFTLILDGYDELTSSRTRAVNDEIKRLEVPFSESSILITSRHGGEEIKFLTGFTNYEIKPLMLEQAISLVELLSYDEAVKRSFLVDLEEKLFNKHKDFLSNPLLLTIMLMTYGDLAEIPSKMHIYYEQAFDTLFYRHDSSKGMYRRESKCELAIDDFKDILSCISASSYIRGQITLTHTDLLKFIRKAKQTTNIQRFNPKQYIEDLVQSVCLFLPDGTRYTYNHRSFQEYFAALFLIQIPAEKKLDVYRRYLNRDSTDSALKLAFEMNQAMVERDFIEPMLNEILEIADDPVKLIRIQMSAISLSRQKRRRSINGRVKNSLSKPSYNLIESTEYWAFQLFLEKMYERTAKRYLKFGVMTTKAFVEEFGKGEVSESVHMDSTDSPAVVATLERIGILEISKRRLDFLLHLKQQIENHNKRTTCSDLESWL